MLICTRCGKVFSEDDVKKYDNYVPYGSTYVLESITDCCPHCGSDDLEDAVECYWCNKIIPISKAHFNVYSEEYFCEDCYVDDSDSY